MEASVKVKKAVRKFGNLTEGGAEPNLMKDVITFEEIWTKTRYVLDSRQIKELRSVAIRMLRMLVPSHREMELLV